ncbi:MAG: hypothetical protein WDM76_02830 [Limisphaerales bacterium]
MAKNRAIYFDYIHSNSFQFQKMQGNYENVIHQLEEVDTKLAQLNKDLATIDDELFSDEYEIKIKEQVSKFNKYFSAVSHELYGEKYALKVDTKVWRGRRLYEFTAFNTNFSSGKKQGEISCFDIAYTLFASLLTLKKSRACIFYSTTKRADARQSTCNDCQTRQCEGNPVCGINFEGQTSEGTQQGRVYYSETFSKR